MSGQRWGDSQRDRDELDRWLTTEPESYGGETTEDDEIPSEEQELIWLMADCDEPE